MHRLQSTSFELLFFSFIPSLFAVLRNVSIFSIQNRHHDRFVEPIVIVVSFGEAIYRLRYTICICKYVYCELYLNTVYIIYTLYNTCIPK